MRCRSGRFEVGDNAQEVRLLDNEACVLRARHIRREHGVDA